MRSSSIWQQVDEKIKELRTLTEHQWKQGEWELAALGERVILTAEQSKIESAALRASYEALRESIENLQKHLQSKITLT
ncbi:MAG: hypothetical protein NUV31_06305 [Dehalococcoidales bacterium]|jgi:hypothetical protein|nr:hypothetical protein [Dehalococcoidales bacterium]